jgi:phosphatidylglycerol:prolipoprotein diacylglycerol transferase
MHPELFKIPYVGLHINTYGLMMVIGFLAAVSLIRYLSREITPDPQLITNAALYSLIAGVVGARLFYVIHHYDQLEGGILSVFAIWRGGLELYGAVLFAVPVIFFYLLYHKLPARQYLDILAMGLMLALVFGRIGCFMRGCCFGKPSNLPWAVRFPYGSDAYYSQIYPDLKRGRNEAYLELPEEFFGSYTAKDGTPVYGLKPYEELTEQQKDSVKNGKYRCMTVHPTQLYSSANAAVLCLILYLFWQRSQKAGKTANMNRLFTKSGSTFALMFIIYGISRFLIEFVRDDNPFELDGLTVSQIISVVMIVFGGILMTVFHKMKPEASSRSGR